MESKFVSGSTFMSELGSITTDQIRTIHGELKVEPEASNVWKDFIEELAAEFDEMSTSSPI